MESFCTGLRSSGEQTTGTHDAESQRAAGNETEGQQLTCAKSAKCRARISVEINSRLTEASKCVRDSTLALAASHASGCNNTLGNPHQTSCAGLVLHRRQRKDARPTRRPQ